MYIYTDSGKQREKGKRKAGTQTMKWVKEKQLLKIFLIARIINSAAVSVYDY